MTCRSRAVWLGLPAVLLLASATAAWAGTPLPAMPLGSPGDWVTTSDYPPDALRNSSTGTTVFELSINPQGTVESCKVAESSGFNDLDLATCNLITQRARFSAARDAQGRAVEGAYRNKVRWVLPNVKTETHPLGTSVQEFTFIVETNGKITECKVLQQQEFGSLPGQDICAGVMGLSRGPVVDGSGRPVRKRITIKSISTAEMTRTTTISDP